MTLVTTQIEEIEAQAEDLLADAFGSSSLVPVPVNVNAIAARLGLTIKQGMFLDPNISGRYEKAKQTIYIAEGEPPARQAFTVAHEIGHFMRHADLDQETYYRNPGFATTPDKALEQEANWFAASLLMPRAMVETYWSTTKNVATLADIFGVSHTAMLNRLRNLGLTQD